MMMLLNKYKAYGIIGIFLVLILTSAVLYVRLSTANSIISKKDITISDMEKNYFKSAAEYTGKLRVIEHTNTQIVQAKDEQLRKLRIQHEKTIIDINTDYANRMLNMQTRLQKYAVLAKSDSPDLRNLANHAARLDRTLEEGRQLVRELRAGIEFRDNQLKVLGELLQEERAIHTE